MARTAAVQTAGARPGVSLLVTGGRAHGGSWEAAAASGVEPPGAAASGAGEEAGAAVSSTSCPTGWTFPAAAKPQSSRLAASS